MLLLLAAGCTFLHHRTELNVMPASRPMPTDIELGRYVAATDCQDWVFGLVGLQAGYDPADLLRQAEGRRGLVAVSIEHRRRFWLFGHTECVTISGYQVAAASAPAINVAVTELPEPEIAPAPVMTRTQSSTGPSTVPTTGFEVMVRFAGVELGDLVPKSMPRKDGRVSIPPRDFYGLPARSITIGVDADNVARRVDFVVDAEPERVLEVAQAEWGPPDGLTTKWSRDGLSVWIIDTKVSIRRE